MSKVKVQIVEDEFIVAEEISEILKVQGFDVVGHAANAEDALSIFEKTQPDVVLMDINIDGEKDGISLAKELKAKQAVAIIFLTAFDDPGYLKRAATVEPEAYLVKPFETKNLNAAITLAVQKLANAGHQSEEEDLFLSDRIFIRDAKRLVKVMIDEILYVEAKGSYCELVTNEGKHTMAVNLKHFEERLDDQMFLRVHRSFLASVKGIEALDSHQVIIGGKEIPINATVKEQLLNRLKRI